MSDAGRNAIVVGFDLSDASRRAVWWAAREAGNRRRPLLLLHAFTWPFEEVVHSLQEAMRHELDALRETCGQIVPGLEVRTELASGDPAWVLSDTAEQAELLVLGPSGMGGAPRGALGSTAAELVSRRAGVPMVVVRGAAPPEQPELATGPAVVGVDGSPASSEAIAFAYDFAARHGVELVAVHAWSDLPLDPFARVQDWERGWDEVRTDAADVLAQSLAGEMEQYPDVSVRRVITPARPAQALLEEAEGASMLIVGSHGRGPVRRLVLGSVSHAAVHHASCPVAVVPAKRGS